MTIEATYHFFSDFRFGLSALMSLTGCNELIVISRIYLSIKIKQTRNRFGKSGIFKMPKRKNLYIAVEAFIFMFAGEISRSDELMNERHGCRTGLLSRDAVGQPRRLK